MIRTKSRDYAWNKGWIEFEAPNAQGVYWLRTKDGKTIFVGKGNIREHLLSHWDQSSVEVGGVYTVDALSASILPGK